MDIKLTEGVLYLLKLFSGVLVIELASTQLEAISHVRYYVVHYFINILIN